MQYERAATLARSPDFNRCAEPLGELLLQARDIAVRFLVPPRGRRAHQALHQGFGLAYRKSFGSDARAELDLPRAVEGEQGARMPHLERAAHELLLYGFRGCTEP